MAARDQAQLDASKAWKKAHPERHAELARAYRSRNREKTRAQNLLNYAIRSGQMERGACEQCGTKERVHGHHEDYNAPYTVKWLCYLCHKSSHPVDEEDKRTKFPGAKRGCAKGENNSLAVLTDSDVRKIRQLLLIKIPQQKIALAFGVTQTTISRISRGKGWSHVE